MRRFFQAFHLRFWFRWLWRVLLLLVVIDIAYIASLWPAWADFAEGPIPSSAFISKYRAESVLDSQLPALRWKPIGFSRLPKSLKRAVIVAEDARFYSHHGIDFEAMREVMEYNLSKKRFAYGGSTLSQQTVKNMFLSSSRNPLRKWHEIVLTVAMEKKLSKQRILEIYLNVAEFGQGIYGVNAAAYHYWGIPASRLNAQQSLELAATLPAPKNHNPKTRSPFFLRKVKKIGRYL